MSSKISTVDLIISGGTILCIDPEMRVLKNHNIAIQNGIIRDIYPTTSAIYEAAETIDAQDCIVIPGLINAHTHVPMTYFRGLADDLPLDTWLRNHIWPAEARHVSPRLVYDASLHGAAEMIKNGIVLLNDMYFFCEQTAQALTTIGMRGILGEAVIQAMMSADGIHNIGKQALQLRTQFADNPLIDFALSPHSIYTCDRSVLEKCTDIALSHDMMIHMHLCETKSESENCLKEHGIKPVFYLDQIGLLKAHAVMAHGVWIDEDEMELLAHHGNSIITCTDSNLKLVSGIAPLQQYAAHGVNVCMGTDGVASNNNLDMLSEMDITAKIHKITTGDPSFLPASDVLRMATINGAKALGLEASMGSLEIGKNADVVLLSLDALETQPLYNPYSHVVYAMNSNCVRDVVIAGEIVLQNRVLTKVDEAEIIATAKTYQKQIASEQEK
ncbi:MAG: cytosine deaminase [Candidatus Cloacimonetes bacterium HGW-Cloacimonetes-1]|jgi:5-methylthioadenosine/S-adenosylhomocysteine deaminase|nr:MAG: cytosine deaminase [Candidatus Cloacimonetes bacterium HGW-Cloacimonetes-1]